MEQNIKVQCETLGVIEQRNLIEVVNNIKSIITKDEYVSIMCICKEVIDRVVTEAEKQGIKI